MTLRQFTGNFWSAETADLEIGNLVFANGVVVTDMEQFRLLITSPPKEDFEQMLKEYFQGQGEVVFIGKMDWVIRQSPSSGVLVCVRPLTGQVWFYVHQICLQINPKQAQGE